MYQESLVIILQFKDGLYTDINPKKQNKKIGKEEEEIRNFFLNCITRANVFKESNEHYPENIEDLIGWEEIYYESLD